LGFYSTGHLGAAPQIRRSGRTANGILTKVRRRTRDCVKEDGRGPHQPITLLVGEDAPIIRAALTRLLRDHPELSVIGEVHTNELLKITREQLPDVVLISAVYPEARFLPLVQSILRLPKSPAVMMVATYKRPEHVREFFRIGGSGCVLTRAPIATMFAAIRRIAAGRKYIDPEVSDEVVIALVGDRGRPRRGVLSPREEQTLELLARGYTLKEVAQKMQVRPSTVETFRARIAEKLDLHGRADFVRYALARAILKPDEEDSGAIVEERNRGAA
jgi:DNA-binding NarL/FixJ family response regulator